MEALGVPRYVRDALRAPGAGGRGATVMDVRTPLRPGAAAARGGEEERRSTEHPEVPREAL